MKPAGVPVGKDNDYGYGVPLGQKLREVLEFAPALNISTLLTGVVAIGMIGMIGMIVKVMK